MRPVPTRDGREIQSPWFTAEEAAAYLRIESEDGSLHAFYLAYRRMGIRAYRMKGGRSLRFHQADLDAALEAARVEPEERRGYDHNHAQSTMPVRGRGSVRRR